MSSFRALCASRQYVDEEFVLRVMTQLALALRECHRRNDGGHTVLHRDLKPANVFLDGQCNVKLGDFGLARILNHDTSFARTFVGTPYYMSPVSVSAHSTFKASSPSEKAEGGSLLNNVQCWELVFWVVIVSFLVPVRLSGAFV